MAANKVIYGGRTLIDLTADTVTPETLAEGVIAHDKSGALITGTMRASEDLSAVLAEQEQLIATLQETLRGKTAGEGGSEDTRFADLVHGTLAEVDDASITSVKQYGLAYINELRTVNLPNATSVNPSAFRECQNLETVNLPSATGSIGSYTFYNCSRLKAVNIPLVTTSSTAVFQNCVELEKVDFGINMSSVGTNAFSGCTKLTALIIRGGRSNGTAPPNLTNANAFANTPIAAGTGYVYVDAGLLDKYKAATNWSTYAAQIRAREDYPEICGEV